MANEQQVALDPLPVPQIQQPEYKPPTLAPNPELTQGGVGMMGKTGQVADIASNFLGGWLKGKQQAAQKKLAQAQQSVSGAQYAFQISQQNAGQVMNSPDATPEEKQKAEAARQQAWKAYLDVAQQYMTPEKQSGKKNGGGGVKGAMSGIGEHLKKAIGTEDPHLYSQATMALLRTTGPPALPQKSSQEQMADLTLKGQKKEASLVDQITDLRGQPQTPDVQKKIADAEANLRDLRGQLEKFKPVTSGQPIPGDRAINPRTGQPMGKPTDFFFPVVDENGRVTDYIPTGAPKEIASDKKKEDSIAEYMKANTKATRQQAEDWYAKQTTEQMEHKTNPPPTTAITIDSTPQGPAVSKVTNTGKGNVKPPSLDALPGGSKDKTGLDWAVPAEGRKAIAKAQDQYQNVHKSYDLARQTAERIKKDPQYAQTGDGLLLAAHIGMTLKQAGVRPTKTMWEEVQKQRPWLQGVQVMFDHGVVSGAILHPEQRKQIVEMMGDNDREMQNGVLEEKTRYGLMVKLQDKEGGLQYLDKKDYDANKADIEKEGYTVIPVE